MHPSVLFPALSTTLAAILQGIFFLGSILGAVCVAILYVQKEIRGNRKSEDSADDHMRKRLDSLESDHKALNREIAIVRIDLEYARRLSRIKDIRLDYNILVIGVC